MAGSGGGWLWRLVLEDGVDCVGERADTVDVVCVLCSEFDLAVVSPDGGRPRILGEGAHMGEVCRCEILVDGEGWADSLGGGVRSLGEDIIFVLEDEVAYEGGREFDNNRTGGWIFGWDAEGRQ